MFRNMLITLVGGGILGWVFRDVPVLALTLAGAWGIWCGYHFPSVKR